MGILRAASPYVRILLVLWLVVTVVFISLRLAPGDPAMLLLGPTAGRQDVAERLDEIRERYGLNRPIIAQYGIYLKDVLTGNLGNSNRSNRPVLMMIATAAPITIILIAWSLLLAIPISIYFGIMAARYQGSVFDRVTRGAATLALAVPSFWIGLLLLNLFAIRLRFFPASGYVPIYEDFLGHITHILLPVTTLAIYIFGTLTRFVYTETADTLEKDYIIVSRAMGIKSRPLLFRFAARNSLTPMIIIVGLETGTLIGGAVIVEEVFGLPGLGRLLLNAVLGRDYPVVQGTVLAITLAVIFLNLLAEFIYLWLNPQASK